MASVDPSHISTVEIAGIQFNVRELKIAGRRDITKALEAFTKQGSVLAMFDTLANCSVKYVTGWDRNEEFNIAAMEEVLDVMDLIALLKAILFNGMLTEGDKKKSESQPLSNGENSATDAASNALKKISESNAHCVTVTAATDATTGILASTVQENFAPHSMTKSI